MALLNNVGEMAKKMSVVAHVHETSFQHHV